MRTFLPEDMPRGGDLYQDRDAALEGKLVLVLRAWRDALGSVKVEVLRCDRIELMNGSYLLSYHRRVGRRS